MLGNIIAGILVLGMAVFFISVIIDGLIMADRLDKYMKQLKKKESE